MLCSSPLEDDEVTFSYSYNQQHNNNFFIIVVENPNENK